MNESMINDVAATDGRRGGGRNSSNNNNGTQDGYCEIAPRPDDDRHPRRVVDVNRHLSCSTVSLESLLYRPTVYDDEGRDVGGVDEFDASGYGFPDGIRNDDGDDDVPVPVTQDDLDIMLRHQDFPRLLSLVAQVKRARRNGYGAADASATEATVAVVASTETKKNGTPKKKKEKGSGKKQGTGSDTATAATDNCLREDEGEVADAVARLQEQLLSNPSDQKGRIIAYGVYPITDSILRDNIAMLQSELDRYNGGGGGVGTDGNNGDDVLAAPSPTATGMKKPTTSNSNNSSSPKRGDGIAIKYSKWQTDILMGWMIEHIDEPFPSQRDIGQLMERTGLSNSQVVNWTTNVRKRNRKATCRGGKKPHHFIDFLFLKQDREGKNKNDDGGGGASPPPSPPKKASPAADAFPSFDVSPPGTTSSTIARRGIVPKKKKNLPLCRQRVPGNSSSSTVVKVTHQDNAGAAPHASPVRSSSSGTVGAPTQKEERYRSRPSSSPSSSGKYYQPRPLELPPPPPTGQHRPYNYRPHPMPRPPAGLPSHRYNNNDYRPRHHHHPMPHQPAVADSSLSQLLHQPVGELDPIALSLEEEESSGNDNEEMAILSEFADFWLPEDEGDDDRAAQQQSTTMTTSSTHNRRYNNNNNHPRRKNQSSCRLTTTTATATTAPHHPSLLPSVTTEDDGLVNNESSCYHRRRHPPSARNPSSPPPQPHYYRDQSHRNANVAGGNNSKKRQDRSDDAYYYTTGNYYGQFEEQQDDDGMIGHEDDEQDDNDDNWASTFSSSGFFE